MSISLIVSGAGALVAVIGFVMLLLRCSRTPRGDLIAWSVAMFGLLVSLGAQALGHALGFSAVTFRAMETGSQVIAPMALIMGLSEAVARSMAGRFAGRLLIPAFAIIPLVVFGSDPLTGTAFSTAWPSPATYYQLIPNKLLEYGLAPVTAIVAVVLMAIAARRSGREFAWRAALAPVIAIGVAVLVLALPGLAPALRDDVGMSLPLASLFAVLCVVAAVATWYGGIGTATVPIDALRDASLRSGDDRDRYADDPRDRAAQAGTARGADRPHDRGYDSAAYGAYDNSAYESPPYDNSAYDNSAYENRAYDNSRYDNSAYDNSAYDNKAYDSAYDNSVSHGRGARDDGSRDRAAAPWSGPDQAGPAQAGVDQTGVDQTGDMDAYQDGAQAVRGGTRDHDFPGYVGPRTGDMATPDDDVALAARGASQGASPGDGQRSDGREEFFGQIAIYTLIEDQVAEFDRLTQRVVSQVRAGEPSTLVYIVHAVPSAPMQRILYEVYRDRAAYEQHLRQPYVSQFEEDRRPYVLATNVIELGLQHAKVAPFPSIADLFGEPGYDTSGFERPDFTREYGSTGAGPAGRGGRRRAP
ncbi:MAG: antibiotic biosynthesis monooxygenase [Streptosporangiaceae bacterium]